MACHKLTRQIAIHEAGHAVVAHALGINGLRICTFEHGFACGMEVPDDPGPIDEWILAVVTAAGAAAEKACGLEPGEGHAAHGARRAGTTATRPTF